IAGKRKSARLLRSVRLIEHDEHEIARRVDRENCAERRNKLMRLITMRPRFFGRSGLSAYVVTGNVRLAARSIGDDITKKLAHRYARLGLYELIAACVRRMFEESWNDLPPAIRDGRSCTDQGHQPNRTSVPE